MQVYRAAFIICLIDSLSVYVNNLFDPLLQSLVPLTCSSPGVGTVMVGPPGMFGVRAATPSSCREHAPPGACFTPSQSRSAMIDTHKYL